MAFVITKGFRITKVHEIKSAHPELVSALVPLYRNNLILTSGPNGQIKLWTLTNNDVSV